MLIFTRVCMAIPSFLTRRCRFQSRHADELSFENGDEVPILGDAEDPGWYRAVINGKIGLVPGMQRNNAYLQARRLHSSFASHAFEKKLE